MYCFQARRQLCTNATARRLLALIELKQSNLAFSADCTKAEHLLALADQVGPEICVLKTHIDMIEDFSWSLIEKLTELATKHQFIIFEDRKFADIGHTVRQQYGHGIYRIADWAPISNAHLLPGPGIIQGLQQVGLAKGNGLLLLAEMSSQGNLITPDYTQKAVQWAAQYPEFVIGFISQHRLDATGRFITMTPGVQFNQSGDTLGQQYVTPEQAILAHGSDIIIVGRGIYQALQPQQSAARYRQAAWEAHQQRVR